MLGEVIGARNAYGVTGIAPAVHFFLVPANCTDGTGGCRLENAIETAASLLEPGDVIILEQQPSSMPASHLPCSGLTSAFAATVPP